MPIKTTTDSSKNLTIFTAIGELTFDAQMAVLKAFYEDTPTKNVLWDFRMITGSRISPEELKQIIQYIKAHYEKRTSGKTALVSSELVDYGMARMGSIIAEVNQIPIDICAFQNYDDAVEWICEND